MRSNQKLLCKPYSYNHAHVCYMIWYIGWEHPLWPVRGLKKNKKQKKHPHRIWHKCVWLSMFLLLWKLTETKLITNHLEILQNKTQNIHSMAQRSPKYLKNEWKMLSKTDKMNRRHKMIINNMASWFVVVLCLFQCVGLAPVECMGGLLHTCPLCHDPSIAHHLYV